MMSGSTVASGGRVLGWMGGLLLFWVVPGAGWGVQAARAQAVKRPARGPKLLSRSTHAPKLPFHQERLCHKDTDCVMRPSLCSGCNPCKPTWRGVCNQKTARRIRATRNRIRCALRRCRKCAHRKHWLGTRPVCFGKQCTLAPLRPTTKKVPRSLRCKRHSDCGFLPPPMCACRPCGLYWRQPANRATIRRMLSLRTQARFCRRRRCQRCLRRALGKKSLCLKGRCKIR